ncbi:thiamine transporter [Pullulanibacillus pueri]|uniref:Thiamine transporter ThiT n=1 Tax=Pullulanibacillus pueri TaxID=1437324 RepID=A0A8J3EJK2_9BACL|nr:energy-coupled thiamine transporter ThiT [Pullulanibacillus pueri]MBM7680187.1 thiamine transporter [Pullulanibacillus pueri]GGH74795.1 thiamine transporter ThiT [Pullulanibacillus pueri]
MNTQTNKVLLLTEAAIMIALSVILSFMKFSGPWLYGGSVSFEMLPIVLFALRRGLLWGAISGAVYGIIDCLIDPWVVHPVQFLLDYPVAFLVVGFAGLFKITKAQSNMKKVWIIISATALGSFLRLVSHFLSGVIWFGSDAPKGTPVAVYSFLYSLGYILPSFILIAFVLSLFVKSAPQLLERK